MVALLDINVLLALAWPTHEHRAPARQFALTMGEWATTPITESGFVRISANPRIFEDAVPVQAAAAMLRELTDDEQHRFLADDVAVGSNRFLDNASGHRQVTDAHLVALAARYGGQLVTFDRGIRDMLRRADRHLVKLLTV